MNPKDELTTFLYKSVSRSDSAYYSFLFNFKFSDLTIDYSKQEDKKLINGLFARVVHYLFYRWNSMDCVYLIYSLSEFKYIYDKLRKQLTDVFEIEVATKVEDGYDRSLYIKIVCNNTTRFYAYKDGKFIIIKQDEFEEAKIENESRPVLKLKEMEIIND